MPKGGLYFDLIDRKYENAHTIEGDRRTAHREALKMWISIIWKTVQKLYETTDKALLMGFGGNVFEAGQSDFGYENFYVNIAIEQDLMHHYFERITDRYIEDLKN